MSTGADDQAVSAKREVCVSANITCACRSGGPPASSEGVVLGHICSTVPRNGVGHTLALGQIVRLPF